VSRFVKATAAVLVQGAGGAARRHLARMREYGTPIVAAVRPGAGGRTFDGVPVFGSVADAVEATGAGASVAFLPAEVVVEGLAEAAQAGLQLAVSVTEGVPAHDALRAIEAAEVAGMRILGPNSPGMVLPHARRLLGFLPAQLVAPGPVAILARSGTLSYEVALELARAGLGVALWMGIGGDAIKGSTFAGLLPLVLDEPTVEALVLVGEIGGCDEEEAAALLAGTGLPTVALVAGRHAPSGVSLGHAGAIVDGGVGGYEDKVAALEAAGVAVVDRPSAIPGRLSSVLTRVNR